MGNQHSTHNFARQALARARGLQLQIGGPPCRGAIVAYCEGRLDAPRLFQRCTLLEANEFARLAPVIYLRWFMEHAREVRCVPGRCQFPSDQTHLEGCEFLIRLPPGVELPDEYFEVPCRQSGIPELMALDRPSAGRSSERHTHATHGHSDHNGHRNYGGYDEDQGHSGHQGHSGRQEYSTHRRQRDQSRHGGHQARPERPARRRAPHDEAPWEMFDEYPSIDYE